MLGGENEPTSFSKSPTCAPKSWDVPTRIAGHPCHSLSKTTEKGVLHKVFVRETTQPGSGIPSAHKLLPSKLFFEIILSGNPKNYRN